MTVLLTGATDGIGLELARLYIHRDQRLIAVGRRPLGNTLLADEHLPYNYCRVDLAQMDAAQRLNICLDMLQVDAIDLLIHNAAGGYFGAFEEQDNEDMERLITLNLRSPIALTHSLMPRLRAAAQRNRRARVVFVGSIAAFVPSGDYALYAATKAALDDLVYNLGSEFGPSIRFIVAHPGATDTGIFEKSGLDPQRLRGVTLAPPAIVARKIAVAARHGRRRVIIGIGNWLSVRLIFLMPRLVRAFMIRQSRMRQTVIDSETAVQPSVTVNNGGPPSSEEGPSSGHCLIVGGASGIGAALAHTHAADGYHLLLADNNIQGLVAMRSKMSADYSPPQSTKEWIKTLHVDLNNALDRARIITRLKHVGGTDRCLISAGISAVGHFDEIQFEHYDAVLRTNLTAQALLLKELVQHNLIRDGGHIVLFASLSVYSGYPGASVYAACKRALASLAASLDVALMSRHIRVHCVFPGPVRTPHASRYSPDNRYESRRMSPDLVARYIMRAIARDLRSIIPGRSARLAACFGRLAPGLSTYLMKRLVLDRIRKSLL